MRAVAASGPARSRSAARAARSTPGPAGRCEDADAARSTSPPALSGHLPREGGGTPFLALRATSHAGGKDSILGPGGPAAPARGEGSADAAPAGERLPPGGDPAHVGGRQ